MWQDLQYFPSRVLARSSTSYGLESLRLQYNATSAIMHRMCSLLQQFKRLNMFIAVVCGRKNACSWAHTLKDSSGIEDSRNSDFPKIRKECARNATEKQHKIHDTCVFPFGGKLKNKQQSKRVELLVNICLHCSRRIPLHWHVAPLPITQRMPQLHVRPTKLNSAKRLHQRVYRLQLHIEKNIMREILRISLRDHLMRSFWEIIWGRFWKVFGGYSERWSEGDSERWSLGDSEKHSERLSEEDILRDYLREILRGILRIFWEMIWGRFWEMISGIFKEILWEMKQGTHGETLASYKDSGADRIP